ncbi:MAG: DUF4474 domain-containing protein [Blautia sp.]|nr:DUF4474 domain-containing protein [Blautia sp.]
MEPLEIVKAVLPAVGIIILVLLAFAAYRHRKKCVCKVQGMPEWEKLEKINALAEPFGFFYVKDWDIFSTRRDAWQRQAGYEALFDAAAPAVHMVMDIWPVYFDYEGRTWLIEFWKGQYGINMGAEVGVYHADRILVPREYPYAHFDAASDDELPLIKSRLMREGETIYAYEARHWWLTGFSMGRFSKPGQLVLYTTIAFDDAAMAEAFCAGLKGAADAYEHCGNRVYVRMENGAGILRGKIHRSWAQMWNRFWVRLFCFASRPFTKTVDRLLFFYELLPGCLRRLFGADKKHLRKRKKRKCRL